MDQRLDPRKAAPGGYKAMIGLENYLAECGLDRKLLDLVKLRASQINGCAFCIDMHWKDLRGAGETEPRAVFPMAFIKRCCGSSARKKSPTSRW